MFCGDFWRFFPLKNKHSIPHVVYQWFNKQVEDNHSAQFTGHTLLEGAQDAVSLHSWQSIILADFQFNNPPGTLSPFPETCFPNTQPQPLSLQGALPSHVKDLHLSLLNPIRLQSVHFFSVPESPWTANLQGSLSASLPPHLQFVAIQKPYEGVLSLTTMYPLLL